jgi:hypothetical protein
MPGIIVQFFDENGRPIQPQPEVRRTPPRPARLPPVDPTGVCVVCDGPTERPQWSERQVCAKCCNVQRDASDPFVSPLDGWKPNRPRGSVDRWGFLRSCDAAVGEICECK